MLWPPVTDDRWNCLETREGPTRGRSANRACQLASSSLANDHEDGGPTIQLPAAEARCTLRSLSCVEYMRFKPGDRTAALQMCSAFPLSSVRGHGLAARQCCDGPPHVGVMDVRSFGFTSLGTHRLAVRDGAFRVRVEFSDPGFASDISPLPVVAHTEQFRVSPQSVVGP